MVFGPVIVSPLKHRTPWQQEGTAEDLLPFLVDSKQKEKKKMSVCRGQGKKRAHRDKPQ